MRRVREDGLLLSYLRWVFAGSWDQDGIRLTRPTPRPPQPGECVTLLAESLFAFGLEIT